MKKILVIIISIVLFNGCSIANTPTSKVEEYLSRYQRVDNDVSLSYLQLSIDENISDENKKNYQNLIKDQYRNLSYEIKEEKIDGDTATVIAQVKVTNYKEILDKYDKTNYDDINEYHKLVIESMETQKDKIIYTVDFELNKNSNDEWEVSSLSTKEREKLLGIN